MRETHTDKETQKAGRNQLIEKQCWKGSKSVSPIWGQADLRFLI